MYKWGIHKIILMRQNYNDAILVKHFNFRISIGLNWLLLILLQLLFGLKIQIKCDSDKTVAILMCHKYNANFCSI